MRAGRIDDGLDASVDSSQPGQDSQRRTVARRTAAGSVNDTTMTSSQTGQQGRPVADPALHDAADEGDPRPSGVEIR